MYLRYAVFNLVRGDNTYAKNGVYYSDLIHSMIAATPSGLSIHIVLFVFPALALDFRTLIKYTQRNLARAIVLLVSPPV